MTVSVGVLVAFESTVQYDIKMVKGLKNLMAQGNLFFATLTGPGWIYL